jgi:hypothetical protein
MAWVGGWLAGLLGGTRLGAWEYYFRPHVRSAFGPLNGSPFRQKVFSRLASTGSLEAIIETGTFRGTTTEYFARTGLPVYSVEAVPRYFGFAQARLRSLPRAEVRLGDSRSFLIGLSREPAVPKGRVFFYLDAHWSHDLPLRDELITIFQHWTEPIVMIDDFEVPTDPGYGYDDYGNCNALTLAYLAPLARLGFRCFFPTAPAADEVEPRRGWVVLSRDGQSAALLGAMPELREHLPVGTGPSD